MAMRKDSAYDERQQMIQGKVFRRMLIYCVVLILFAKPLLLKLHINLAEGSALDLLFIGAAVIAGITELILRDAMFALRNGMSILPIISSAIIGAILSQDKSVLSYVKDGKLTIRGSTAVVVYMIIAVVIMGLFRNYVNKKREKRGESDE